MKSVLLVILLNAFCLEAMAHELNYTCRTRNSAWKLAYIINVSFGQGGRLDVTSILTPIGRYVSAQNFRSRYKKASGDAVQTTLKNYDALYEKQNDGAVTLKFHGDDHLSGRIDWQLTGTWFLNCVPGTTGR